MDMPQTQNEPQTLPTLARRRSLVFMPGLCAAVVVAAACAGSGWWMLRTADADRHEARAATLRASATFLNAAAGQMIVSQELSRLRALVATAADEHKFRSVRITLGGSNGQVVADSSVQTKFEPLPEKWPSVMADAGQGVERLADGRLKVVEHVAVAGMGTALLEIEDGAMLDPMKGWRTQAGVGGVALGGLIGLMAFGAGVNRRVRSMRAIRDSLAAMSNGEADPSVLAVAPSFGPEAEAWNRFLTERAEMITRQARAGVEQRIGDRRGRDGDLFGLCDAMWQGLLLVDDKLKVKYVNGAGAVFLRGKREEMVGRDISQYVTDKKVLDALKSLATGTGRGRTVIEVEGDKEPGGMVGKPTGAASVFRYSLRPVRKDDAASAVVVIEDITQQRVAEEARHTFVASATHELRTPLTNMRLYIDSLLEDPNLDVQKRTQAVNVVSQEAKRLERMVGDMLSVAQIESGTIKLQKGDVRLEPIFEDLKADFAEQARQKEIKLRFDLPPKWPQMMGDRDKIVMALHNLVGNAIKYTPAGGEVIVRATTSSDEKTFGVDVVDNGIGIKDDEQGLVFEKFYRAQDKRIAGVTGTGLGLSIAREVVRLHGGDISLKSAIDKGSTFTMTLPAKAA